MSKKKGFTLIEVIVSIALLAIIAVGFLGAINNNLNFLRINKEMTTSAFAEQKEMELEILQARVDIENGVIPSGSLTTIEDVFENGIDVKTYQLKFPYNNKDIYTLVTDIRLPEFKVPIAQNVVAKLRKNTTFVDYAYAVPETNILGSTSIDPNTNDVFMVNNYNWYASRAGFNIPMPSSVIPEIEIGNKYPKFPEDYSLIPTSSTTSLNDVTKYAGRHIVFAVTPAAKSGRLGKTVPSNPVFISGLPPMTGTNYVLHLDASTISNTDSSQVTVNGSDLLVQKWIDLSTYNKSAIQNTQNSRPKLKEHQVGGDFVGKYVDFDTSKNLSVQHDSLKDSTLLGFAVVRGNDSTIFYKSNSASITTSGESIGGSNGPWKIVTFNYNTNTHDANNIITLGNSDVDIAELILIRGAITEQNKNDIINYLKEKYIPLVTVGNIVQLRPLTDIEIIRNDPYTLPSAVLAEMEYGSDRYVPVTWLPTTLNTSNLGTFEFTAKAISDNTKTTDLKVIVKDRVNVTGISLNVNTLTFKVGESALLTSTIIPVEATNKAITWESSNPNIVSVSGDGFTSANINALAVGTSTITVRTADGNKIATCTVTVKNPANTISIVSAKYLAEINNSNETSKAVVIRFSDPINLKPGLTSQEFKSISDLFSNSSNIIDVKKWTLDTNSIIVSFSNNIYSAFSPYYSGTKDNNKISNDSIRAMNGNEVNISNGNNFTIKDEILKYTTTNTPNRYRMLMNNFAIDVSGQGTANNTEIILWTNKNNGDANQLWYLTSSDDLTHTIHWGTSNKRYLGVDTQDGLIYQRSNNSGNQFRWIIERYGQDTGIVDYTVRPLNYPNRFLGVESKAENQRIKLIDSSKQYRWEIKKY